MASQFYTYQSIRFRTIVFLAALNTGHSETQQKENNTFSACAIKNVYTKKSCESLDLVCPDDHHIRISNLHYGETKHWVVHCDGNAVCNVTQGCCEASIGDMALTFSQTERRKLFNYCHKKDQCSLPLDLDKPVNYEYRRQYLLVTYICEPSPATKTTPNERPSSSVTSFVLKQSYAGTTKPSSSSTDVKSTTDTSSSANISGVVVPAVMAPVVFITIAVLTGFLIWRWKRHRRRNHTSSIIYVNSKKESKQRNSIRTSNKYETVSVIHTHQENTSSLHLMHSIVTKENEAARDKDALSDISCATEDMNSVAEKGANEYLILEPADLYNHIDLEKILGQNVAKQSATDNDYNRIIFVGRDVKNYEGASGRCASSHIDAAENENYSHLDDWSGQCNKAVGVGDINKSEVVANNEELQTENNPYFILDPESDSSYNNIDYVMSDKQGTETIMTPDNDYDSAGIVTRNVKLDPNYERLGAI